MALYTELRKKFIALNTAYDNQRYINSQGGRGHWTVNDARTLGVYFNFIVYCLILIFLCFHSELFIDHQPPPPTHHLISIKI